MHQLTNSLRYDDVRMEVRNVVTARKVNEVYYMQLHKYKKKYIKFNPSTDLPVRFASETSSIEVYRNGTLLLRQ